MTAIIMNNESEQPDSSDLDPEIDSGIDSGIEEKSKSQIKREKLAIFTLADTLCGLPNKQLKAIQLSDNVTDIVARIRRMPMRDARRRELRYLAKQFTAEDIEKVDAALTQIEQGSRDQAREFHRIERLRDQVVSDPTSGISAVLDEWPDADRQLLNQLARNARKEQDNQKPPANARKLFKYLRSLAIQN